MKNNKYILAISIISGAFCFQCAPINAQTLASATTTITSNAVRPFQTNIPEVALADLANVCWQQGGLAPT